MRRFAVLVVLFSLLAPASPARAAVPDGFGFAAWDGTGAVRKTPATTAIVESPAGSGKYRVTFPGQGRPNAFAHVTGISNSGRWCQVSNWGTSGAGGIDALVFVDCYNTSGVTASSRFSVMYGSSTLPAAGGGAHAYYAYNLAGTPTRFNSTGAVDAAPVDEAGVGSWLMTFNGIGSPAHTGQFQVTAIDYAHGARCKIFTLWVADTYQRVRVKCFGPGGAPVDTRWALSYHDQRKSYGAAGGKFGYGTLWWPGTPPVEFGEFRVGYTNYNSQTGGENSISYSGTGHYVVTMTKVAYPVDNVQVTAFGSDGRLCQLEDMWTTGAVAQMKVVCFEGGQYADSGFSITYATAA